MIARTEIEAAHGRIRPHVRRTPVLDPGAGAFGAEAPLSLKLELLQHTGSFKPRGAFNRILSSDVPEAGVIAASGGNHGLGVAFAANRLGLPAEIFVPDTSPETKIQGIRDLGATVRVVAGYYGEALEASRERAEETGALMVHAFDMPETMAGQGTVALELAEQAPDLDTVLVAIGGGGLIGGIATWYAETGTRVIGVEPERCASMHAALEAGGPVEVEVGGIAADSLGAARVGDHTYPAVAEHVERVVLVPDEVIADAQRRLWHETKLVTEPGGAAALAALLTGGYQPRRGERMGVVLCGANTDPGSVA